MKHTFRGKSYHLYESDTLEGGECTDPNSPKREMTIPIEGEDVYDLEVIIHEALHACQYDICELAIREISHDIATLLWKLNWRKDY